MFEELKPQLEIKNGKTKEEAFVRGEEGHAGGRSDGRRSV